MKQFKSVKIVNVPMVVDVICNRCGESCLPHAHATGFEHAAVDVAWGYNSNKDGTKQHWDLCEKCHDEFVATFKVPPTKSNYLGMGDEELSYEQTGFLPHIPLYPAAHPPRGRDVLDLAKDMERVARERGFQDGARASWHFSAAELELLSEAVRGGFFDYGAQSLPQRGSEKYNAAIALSERIDAMRNKRQAVEAARADAEGKPRPPE